MASTAARAISLDPDSKINPDIQKERDTATFNTLELTYVLDGGREITERRRYVGKCFCLTLINISKSTSPIRLQCMFLFTLTRVRNCKTYFPLIKALYVCLV